MLETASSSLTFKTILFTREMGHEIAKIIDNITTVVYIIYAKMKTNLHVVLYGIPYTQSGWNTTVHDRIPGVYSG